MGLSGRDPIKYKCYRQGVDILRNTGATHTNMFSWGQLKLKRMLPNSKVGMGVHR